MINGIQLKTGIFCSILFLISSCRSDKAATIAALKTEHDTYLQIFQKSFQDLKQQSAQVKATVITSDTVLLQKMAAYDNKIDVYQQRSTEKIAKYQILINRLESGELTVEQMKSIQPEYIQEFKSYEDAVSQLGAGLTEMSQKK